MDVQHGYQAWTSRRIKRTHIANAPAGFCIYLVATAHSNSTAALPFLQSPVAGIPTGAGIPAAHAETPPTPSVGPSSNQGSQNRPSLHASIEAAAADTPSRHNSADFVLTAPNTQGKQEVVERIYLASPSQVLAADPSSMPLASSWGTTGLQTAKQETPNGWQDRMAEVSQHTTAPAVDAATDALHDSLTATDTLAIAARGTGLGFVDPHSDYAAWPGVQTPAGMPLIADLKEEGCMGNTGTAMHRQQEVLVHLVCRNTNLRVKPPECFCLA